MDFQKSCCIVSAMEFQYSCFIVSATELQYSCCIISATEFQYPCCIVNTTEFPHALPFVQWSTKYSKLNSSVERRTITFIFSRCQKQDQQNKPILIEPCSKHQTTLHKAPTLIKTQLLGAQNLTPLPAPPQMTTSKYSPAKLCIPTISQLCPNF